MGTVTAPPWGRPITRDDLDATPDDGHRYELIDGTLLVSPAPSIRHQIAVTQLLRLLQDACPPELRALVAPVDVALSDRSVFQPDLLIARRGDFTDRDLPSAPVLAVEVLTPGSRSIDQVLKHARYAEAGIGHYWIVDPSEPSLTAYLLSPEGTYDLVGHVAGLDAYRTAAPVNVTIVPGNLVTDD